MENVYFYEILSYDLQFITLPNMSEIIFQITFQLVNIFV